MALPADIPKTLAPTLTPVKEWSKGDPITADRLTQHAQQTNKLIQTVSPGRQIVRGHSLGGAAVKQFRMANGFFGDYLICNALDGETEGADYVYIAKPWLLRRTPWDGRTRSGISYAYSGTQTRVASKSGESNESQKVIMSYANNDIIYAIRGVDGGTGVTRTTGEEVVWLDLNVDGRMWAWVA